MQFWRMVAKYILLAVIFSQAVQSSSDVRRELGISRCPWGEQRGNACCEDSLCCRMDGNGCYCLNGDTLMQGPRGEQNGCGPERYGKFMKGAAKALSAEFHDACSAHDDCYTDVTKTQKQCDDKWYDMSEQSCVHTYANANKGWWSWLSTIGNWLALGSPLGYCVSRVGIFYNVMRKDNAWMVSMKDSAFCADSNFHRAYLGCYKDDIHRKFDHQVSGFTSKNLSYKSCRMKCAERKFKYAGLQNGNECFCGNELTSGYKKVGDKECGSKRLGGPWKMAVFYAKNDDPLVRYHLAPQFAAKCDYGLPVPQKLCEWAARLSHSQAPKRRLQVGKGGTCRGGGWGQVPLGCSVQTGGDYAAHYKTSGTTKEGCVHKAFQLVCSNLAKIKVNSFSLTSTYQNKFPAKNCFNGNMDTICHGGNRHGDTLTAKISRSNVGFVRIHNRKDCCTDRIKGAEVRVDGTLCGTVQSTGAVIDVVCPKGLVGTSVTLKTNQYLNIIQLEIF